MEEKKRCFGNNLPLYAQYHDEEWGIAVHDDQKLFEMLILEGAQAGLSWETVLKKREGYRRAYLGFDPKKVALMEDEELEKLMKCEGIIRNRLKIWSARQNSRVFLKIQGEFGSFSKYLWNFVDHRPIIHRPHRLSDLPTTTKESDAISKDLKKRGMNFVGSTIIYAFMQAVGMVNDHCIDCWKGQI